MPCVEASQQENRLNYARVLLRAARSPESQHSELDRRALEKQAKQDVRSINRALREHRLVCETCDKEAFPIKANDLSSTSYKRECQEKNLAQMARC
jgi:hypothetical protein